MRKKPKTVEVECKKCHLRYQKKERELVYWSGSCADCARDERKRQYGASCPA